MVHGLLLATVGDVAPFVQVWPVCRLSRDHHVRPQVLVKGTLAPLEIFATFSVH